MTRGIRERTASESLTKCHNSEQIVIPAAPEFVIFFTISGGVCRFALAADMVLYVFHVFSFDVCFF